MKLICEERLRLMTGRQAVPAWGADYDPAIHATPAEAPRISKPAILRPAKLGREMHLLSSAEVAAALLALYHPDTVDIQEQRLLSTVAACHPMQGSPHYCGPPLPALRGTVVVAESLRMLARHPKIFVSDQGGDGDWVPFPYVGDLLLFVSDTHGPYCVNWNVKLSPEDYHRRIQGSLTPPRRTFPKQQTDLRHQLEETYYADAGIRTVRVTSAEIDKGLVANLRFLFGWHARAARVAADDRKIALDLYRSSMDGGRPAYQAVKTFAELSGVSIDDAKALLYQLIWKRDLLVDLFNPVLIDRPLIGQHRDPVRVYEHWFRR